MEQLLSFLTGLNGATATSSAHFGRIATILDDWICIIVITYQIIVDIGYLFIFLSMRVVDFGFGDGFQAGVPLMLTECLSVCNQVIIHLKLAFTGKLIWWWLINGLHGLIGVKLVQIEASIWLDAASLTNWAHRRGHGRVGVSVAINSNNPFFH